jgi:pimeloyl-ACP methyl ester carboxylesterase
MNRNQKQMAAGIPGAKAVFVDGVGHEIYVDKADDCIKEINEFIASLHEKK